LKKWLGSNFYLPSLMARGLNCVDYFILDWLYVFKESGKMHSKKVFFSKPRQYLTGVYVKYQKIIDDLQKMIPIQTTETIGKRIQKYEDAGLIYKALVKNNGTFVYIHFIEEQWNSLVSEIKSTEKTEYPDLNPGIDGSKAVSRLVFKTGTNNSKAIHSKVTNTGDVKKTKSYAIVAKVFGEKVSEFSSDFFMNLDDFFEKHFLEKEKRQDYLSYIKAYALEKIKTEDALAGYVYKTVFLENMLHSFLNLLNQKPKVETSSKSNLHRCKACGEDYEKSEPHCPVCQLTISEESDKEKVEYHHRVSLLSPEKRTAFFLALSATLSRNWKKGKSSASEDTLNEIKKEYGLIDN